jgi:hypothetical protein
MDNTFPKSIISNQFNNMSSNAQYSTIFDKQDMTYAPVNWSSLFIPALPAELVDEDSIKYIFENIHPVGQVRRVDFVQKNSANRYMAFVHFNSWNSLPQTQNLRSTIEGQGYVDLYVPQYATPYKRGDLFVRVMINKTPIKETTLNAHQLAAELEVANSTIDEQAETIRQLSEKVCYLERLVEESDVQIGELNDQCVTSTNKRFKERVRFTNELDEISKERYQERVRFTNELDQISKERDELLLSLNSQTEMAMMYEAKVKEQEDSINGILRELIDAKSQVDELEHCLNDERSLRYAESAFDSLAGVEFFSDDKTMTIDELNTAFCQEDVSEENPLALQLPEPFEMQVEEIDIEAGFKTPTKNEQDRTLFSPPPVRKSKKA